MVLIQHSKILQIKMCIFFFCIWPNWSTSKSFVFPLIISVNEKMGFVFKSFIHLEGYLERSSIIFDILDPGTIQEL